MNFLGWPVTLSTLLCMVFHLAERDQCFAVYFTSWAQNQPPLALLLVLHNLVIWGPLGATLVTALMLDLLNNCKCKQAFALSKGFPAGGAVQLGSEYLSKHLKQPFGDFLKLLR